MHKAISRLHHGTFVNSVNILFMLHYICVRFDRSKDCGKLSGGGLLIYVHESFKFEVLEPNISFPELTETVTIKVYRDFIQPIIVSIIYNNPASSKVQFLESF